MPNIITNHAVAYTNTIYVDIVLNANKDCSFCFWLTQAEFSSTFNFDWYGGNIEPTEVSVIKRKKLWKKESSLIISQSHAVC